MRKRRSPGNRWHMNKTLGADAGVRGTCYSGHGRSAADG